MRLCAFELLAFAPKERPRLDISDPATYADCGSGAVWIDCIAGAAEPGTLVDSSRAVIIPPIIGAAMPRMTSLSVPLPHMFGNKPSYTS